eukprot:3547984-Lingulodinium_polyedra.AAC.1
MEKVKTDLKMLEKGKAKIIGLEVKVQPLDPKKCSSRKDMVFKDLEECIEIHSKFMDGAFGDMKRCLKDVK